MVDSVDTDPDVIMAGSVDPFNAVLNVSKQESLGLVTSGVAPGMQASGAASGTSGGWVSFVAAESAAVPGQFSEAPAYTGGTGGDPIEGPGGYYPSKWKEGFTGLDGSPELV